MSANFYKVLAQMGGIDLHHFQVLSPNPADATKGARLDNWPYVVHAGHAGSNDMAKVAETVTADGVCMIRDGFTIHKVAHQFVPLGPPHPFEFVEQHRIQGASQSTPFLKAPSVTSSGDALAVCSVRAVGANLNCHDSGMVLSGIVLCPCSVVTKAQFAAVVARIFDDIKKILLEALPKLIDLILEKYKIRARTRAIVKWVWDHVAPPLLDAVTKVAKALAEWAEPSL
jgi:hypothetical protein